MDGNAALQFESSPERPATAPALPVQLLDASDGEADSDAEEDAEGVSQINTLVAARGAAVADGPGDAAAMANAAAAEAKEEEEQAEAVPGLAEDEAMADALATSVAVNMC